jgi:hypothetical protein
MNYQHKNLAAGKWEEMSFLEQMANIGSEVERTITWKEKGNKEYSQKAFERSLELFDLTLNSDLKYSRLKEVARARELWVDFVKYDNDFQSTAEQWRKYFYQLLFALKSKDI